MDRLPLDDSNPATHWKGSKQKKAMNKQSQLKPSSGVSRRRKLENLDPAQLTAEIRKSIHAQLSIHGHTVREVSRRYGVTDTTAHQVALQLEREVLTRRIAALEAQIRRMRAFLPISPRIS